MNNKVNILYKTEKLFKGPLMAKCKNRAIGAKNAPSWEKICFQLGNYFFPTRNPHLRGYSDFVGFIPYFRSEPTYNRAENRVKRFYI